MAPTRKRQRLSEDGKAAASVTIPEDEIEEPEYAKPAKQHKSSRSLFVRSLPSSATNEDLADLFSQSYPIKHATAVIDPETKLCKGYGFVTFADAEDAQRARDEFDGSKLQGRQIKVEVAEPRHRNGENEENPHSAARKQQEREQATQAPPKLIVRNLPWSIKEPDQLAALFRSYGKVNHVALPKNKAGLLAGFGIVLIRGRKNAEKALAGVNGKEIDGRTIAVDWAVDKETWQKVKEDETAQDNAEDGTLKPPADRDTQEEDVESDDGEEIADEGEDDEDVGDSEEDEDDEDDEDEDLDEDESLTAQEEQDRPRPLMQDHSSTLFIRNLPFTCTDEDLSEHFEAFGPVRYARIVMDKETDRPRGTGFVCFVKVADAEECLKAAPKNQNAGEMASMKKGNNVGVPHSILQNVDADPTGNYTMDGRVLQLSAAVNRNEASRLTEQGIAHRHLRDPYKRRLYLLSEGTIASNSPLYQTLSSSEIAMREASAKQRKTIIESNPSLHLSLTRLAVRNVPRSVTSKDLKALAREAVVEFAKGVKEGKRQPLSKEETSRGGEDMKEAEKLRKAKGKGIVKQATITFESQEGGKVSESSGAGRSRGYGFIEYYTHRNALMGLRWLNGHAIDYTTRETKGKSASKEELQDRKKRLIVEFAIENAQVVARRRDREEKSRSDEKGSHDTDQQGRGRRSGRDNKGKGFKSQKSDHDSSRKRKRGSGKDEPESAAGSKKQSPEEKLPVDEKLAKRQKIIQRKRMMRRSRKHQANGA